MKVENSYAWAMGFPQEAKPCDSAASCAGLAIEEMVAVGDREVEVYAHAGAQ